MKASFSVTVDPAISLVRITMAGFFEHADIQRYVIARDLAHARLRCAPNAHVTLVDIREMDIQSQETVATFQQVLSAPHAASRRLAFVVARSLARKQVQRAAEGRDAAYFLTLEEAEDWLLERQAVAA